MRNLIEKVKSCIQNIFAGTNPYWKTIGDNKGKLNVSFISHSSVITPQRKNEKIKRMGSKTNQARTEKAFRFTEVTHSFENISE